VVVHVQGEELKPFAIPEGGKFDVEEVVAPAMKEEDCPPLGR
jgi:hypothetical protein